MLEIQAIRRLQRLSKGRVSIMDMAIAKSVYEHRFGILDGQPLSLEMVSQKFGITREEARIMETEYLKSLHPVQKGRKLRDYLD